MIQARVKISRPGSLSGAPLRRLRLCALLALLLTSPLTATTASAEAAAGKKPQAKAAIPVTVTEEMTGAGMVSSGEPLPAIPALTGNRKKPVASWGKPLPYPILIADRRNNRLIEISPDKKVLWEFPSPSLNAATKT